MNRGRITILSVLITLLMVAALLSSFFLSGWAGQNQDPIIIAPKTEQPGRPDGHVPDPRVSRTPFRPLDLTVSRAREIVETLARPHAYSCDITVRWLWPSEGGSQDASRTYRMSVRGGLCAIVENSALRQTHFLMDGDRFLCWTSGGGVIYDGVRGSATADSLCSVPTYEDLLTLPDGAITDIRHETRDDEGFVVVETLDDLYLGQYWIHIETGLLRQAFFHNAETPDELVYTMEMTRYEEGDPGDGAFAINN